MDFARAFDKPKHKPDYYNTIRRAGRRYEQQRTNFEQRFDWDHALRGVNSPTKVLSKQRRLEETLSCFFNINTKAEESFKSYVGSELEVGMDAENTFHNSTIYDYNPHDNQTHHTVVRIPTNLPEITEGREPTIPEVEITHKDITTHEEWLKMYDDVVVYDQKFDSGVHYSGANLLSIPQTVIETSIPVSNNLHNQDPDEVLSGVCDELVLKHKGHIRNIIHKTISQAFWMQGKTVEILTPDLIHDVIHEGRNHKDDRSFRYLRRNMSTQNHFHNGNDPTMNPICLSLDDYSKGNLFNRASPGAGSFISARKAEANIFGHMFCFPMHESPYTGNYIWNPKDVNIIRTHNPRIYIQRHDNSTNYTVSIRDSFRVLVLNKDSIKRIHIDPGIIIPLLDIRRDAVVRDMGTMELNEPEQEEMDEGLDEAFKPNIITKAENVAIETLREELLESEFRNYLKRGFINVKGISGRIYQIFRDKMHVKVWENGELLEEVCVGLGDHKIPPTDKIIAFKIMIESDEEEFKKLGNVYNMKKVA